MFAMQIIKEEVLLLFNHTVLFICVCRSKLVKACDFFTYLVAFPNVCSLSEHVFVCVCMPWILLLSPAFHVPAPVWTALSVFLHVQVCVRECGWWMRPPILRHRVCVYVNLCEIRVSQAVCVRARATSLPARWLWQLDQQHTAYKLSSKHTV